MTLSPERLGCGFTSKSGRIHKSLVASLLFLLPVLSQSFIQPRGMVLWISVVILLLAVTITSIVVVATNGTRMDRDFALWLLAATMLAFAIGYAFHPSWPGLILVVSALAGGVVGISLTRFTHRAIQRWVALPLLGAAAVQALVIWGQTVTGTPWIASLIEPGRSILVTTGEVRPHGLMYHVYEPPALALLAIGAGLAVFPNRGWRRPAFVIGVGMSSSIIALTHSRAALLGLLLVVVVSGLHVLRGDRDLRLPLAVLLVAFLIPAVATIGGWTSRLDESLAPSFDDASLGRLTLMRQAIDLATDHPIVGVGPNRYVEVLERDYGLDPRYPWVVHNVPLAMAAELGTPATAVFTLLLIAAGVQSFRVGPRSFALFLAPMAFFMFDVLHYNRPIGLVMFGIWAGILASLRFQNTHNGHSNRAPAL